MLTRVDQIKRNYKIDYLFSVVTDTNGEDAYKNQLFLFSGAEPGAVRGTGPEDAYVLGVEVSVADNESQQESMRSAVEKSRAKLAAAGDYQYLVSKGVVNDRTETNVSELDREGRIREIARIISGADGISPDAVTYAEQLLSAADHKKQCLP